MSGLEELVSFFNLFFSMSLHVLIDTKKNFNGQTTYIAVLCFFLKIWLGHFPKF